MLKVTNHSKGDHTDSFGGVTYVFRMGEPVEVPEIVAQELFGYGIEDKTPFISRLGWSLTMVDFPNALARLAKFSIEEADETPEPRSLSPAVERVPLPGRQGRVGGKTMAA